MTFKAYLKQANDLAKKNPELLELQVVNSSDDEGNSFTPVEFGASAGLFLEDKEDFILEGEFDLMDLPENTKPNAVCIN
jgi:hypothetical protein